MESQVRSRLSRRPAVVDDCEWARAVHHAALRDVVERQFGVWDAPLQDRFFAGEWAAAPFEIICWDGRPCGYVCLEVRPDDVHLRELVIAPDHQNRGIGTAIVEDAIERARRRHVPVVLQALHRNRAIGLYRRLGFVATGRTETHTQFRRDP
jgi:ribosomal protein S18 acetylase RimI-like enzyme